MPVLVLLTVFREGESQCQRSHDVKVRTLARKVKSPLPVAQAYTPLCALADAPPYHFEERERVGPLDVHLPRMVHSVCVGVAVVEYEPVGNERNHFFGRRAAIVVLSVNEQLQT